MYERFSTETAGKAMLTLRLVPLLQGSRIILKYPGY